MRPIGTPYDKHGTHALEIARDTAPGPGVYTQALRVRWCCRCDLVKPYKGGTNRGALFTCADCGPKVAA